MNDVAKLAGVGRGTVSNYINGYKVQEKNKQKIEKAIKELNYIPNLQARALKTAQNSTVVFIVPTSWTPFFSEMIFKMEKELNRYGYKMILANSHLNPDEEKHILEMATLNQVSGVITMSYSDVYNLQNFSKISNLVAIERFISDDIPLITSDNYAGGKLAAKKLLEKGSTRFLVLRHHDNHHNATDDRTKAFVDYLTAKQKPVDIFEAQSDDYRNEFYHYLSSHYAGHVVPFNGIFAVTDEYGMIAQEALSSIDPSLEHKVKLIGFDGSRISPTTPRRIASIRQPIDEIVHESVKILKQMNDGVKVAKGFKKILDVSYVEKEKLFK